MSDFGSEFDALLAPPDGVRGSRSITRLGALTAAAAASFILLMAAGRGEVEVEVESGRGVVSMCSGCGEGGMRSQGPDVLPMVYARQSGVWGGVGGSERQLPLLLVVPEWTRREVRAEPASVRFAQMGAGGEQARRQEQLSQLMADIEHDQRSKEIARGMGGRGGRRRSFTVFQGNQLLDDSILDFKESDLGTRLVAEAKAEQDIEAGLGGADVPSETDAADALARLVSGDLDFEGQWAKGTENRASTNHAQAASYEALVAMATRDVKYALSDLEKAQAVVDEEQATADGLQATLDSKTAATTAAEGAHEFAVAAEASATQAVAKAEAGVTTAQSNVDFYQVQNAHPAADPLEIQLHTL